MRSIAALFAIGTIVIVSACNGDDSSSGSDQSPIPPASCATPCTTGQLCYGPSESACDGTWYCWSDTKWHCAPPDGGGPGGPPPDAGGGDDGGSTDGPVESSTPGDAPSGG